MVSIIRAKRTAIGKLNGMYKDISLVDMGSSLLKHISQGLKIDEVILGNVLATGVGQNLARQISMKAGLPESTTAYMVNMVCGSGLKSIQLGYQSILLGENDTIIVGGIEKMTGVENLVKEALTDAMNNIHMGITAENVATKYDISRKELDDYAYISQKRVSLAKEKGIFEEEIFNGLVDEYPRYDIQREKLDTLKPAFKEEGLVTAGNSSGINDGAAMLVLMNTNKAIEEKQEILANILGFASAANDPKYMGLAPIIATKKLLEKHNLKAEDIDIFEINEAFASVVLAFEKELNISRDKLNVNGGAISLGHPIGASGTRIVISLVNELKRKNAKLGLATICIGGGQALAVLIQNDENRDR